MAINLASKFSKYVDDAFEHECLLAGATSNRVDFTGVNEVSVYSVDKMEMNDYNPSGTSRYGNVEEIGDRVQTFKIDRDRSFTGSIDEGNAQDQYNVKDASARLHVQIRDVVIPEVETYVFGKWAYGAGKVVGGAAPTAETLLGLIQAGASYMNNHHVPRRGRSIFIAETYAAMLPNLANLTYLERLGAQALTENRLPRVAGFDVRVVPDGDMPRACTSYFSTRTPARLSRSSPSTRSRKTRWASTATSSRAESATGPESSPRSATESTSMRRRTACRPRRNSAAAATPSPSPPPAPLSTTRWTVPTRGTAPRASSSPPAARLT